MEDIAEKLSELLSSPDGMEKIKAVANSLLGDDGGGNLASSLPLEDLGDLGGMEGLGDLGDMKSLLKIGNLLKSAPKDDRINLLLALKPHLSEERKHKVDRAVSMLRLSAVLPVLTEQGLFKF